MIWALSVLDLTDHVPQLYSFRPSDLYTKHLGTEDKAAYKEIIYHHGNDMHSTESTVIKKKGAKSLQYLNH